MANGGSTLSIAGNGKKVALGFDGK